MTYMAAWHSMHSFKPIVFVKVLADYPIWKLCVHQMQRAFLVNGIF